jgi:hypothetical protein
VGITSIKERRSSFFKLRRIHEDDLDLVAACGLLSYETTLKNQRNFCWIKR